MTPDQILFEFRIKEPLNLQQDELQIVTKKKNGFYIVHYVIKTPDMAMQKEMNGFQIFKKAKCVK